MLYRKILRAGRLAEDRLRQVLRLNQSERTLARDAQAFWSRPIDDKNSFWWHARKSEIFADAARCNDLSRPVARMVDWGCGGGANAEAFAPDCRELWGVDVSVDALAECERQLRAAGGVCAFHPVKIDVPDPEAVLAKIPHDIDFFYCMYVFELLPSKAHGERVLRIAHALLRPGGVALVQIKYETASWKTRARRWSYRRGAANMTTYRIEEFWDLAESCGFEPRTATLVPKPPEVADVRYAYFTLRKPYSDAAMTAL